MNGSEHAQSQAIDLEDANFVEIVFVPFNHGAAFHRGIFDGHQLVQRSSA